MREIINHGVNGLKAYCNNVNSLADNILWALQHPDHTSLMKKKALEDVKKIYNWERIAFLTGSVYEQVVKEYLESDWHAVMHEEIARDAAMARMVKTIEAEEMTRYRDIH